MYQHIGKKLKVFAGVWCVLGSLGAAAAAVLLCVSGMQLWTGILIGVGGIIVSILSSWGIYALGDKPNYMSYLEGNQALRGQCEICGKTTDLINAKIVDNLGTRYRKVCRECFSANECETNE